MSRAEPEKVGEEARKQRRECREREAASRATIHHNYEFEPSKDSSANEARNCMEEHLSASCHHDQRFDQTNKNLSPAVLPRLSKWR